MIISASRRTDIPAFYGEWFHNRIKAGYFYRISPYNPSQVKGFSLLPEDVDAFVFWTKNPRPFFKRLGLIDEIGYNYLFLYTLNDYPPVLEPRVPSISERLRAFKELSAKIGPKRVVWRYDPIILSSLTPLEYHLQKITKLASELSGYTKRMVISFLDFYGKVRKRLDRLSNATGIRFEDWLAIENSESLAVLIAQIAAIARDNGIQVFTCSEAIDLEKYGVFQGSCIDGNLINKAFGLDKQWRKDPFQRKDCRCVASVDMGVYDTCKFQCVYCYASNSAGAVRETIKNHYPDSPALIGNYEGELKIEKDLLPY